MNELTKMLGNVLLEKIEKISFPEVKNVIDALMIFAAAHDEAVKESE